MIFFAYYTDMVQKISLEQLNTNSKIQLGKQEPCPCCTDCAIYPILEYMQKTK